VRWWEKKKKHPKTVLIWGGTGQARLVRPVIEYYGYKVVLIVDDVIEVSPFDDVPMIRGAELYDWCVNNKLPGWFCMAIGNPHGDMRLKLGDKLFEAGIGPFPVIHPNTTICRPEHFDDGLQILALSYIAPYCRIGRQVIINARAGIDHECVLEDGVEIGPGATLCGNVNVRQEAWVGAGATVLPRITIGRNAIVGAGAVVTKDVPDGATVKGVPAK
jgi:sugar O-acyltransferase (sialic acid O-acetyltransferase NeuD family)